MMWLVMVDPYHDNNSILGLYKTEAEARSRAEERWIENAGYHQDDIGIWQIKVGDYAHGLGYPDLSYNGTSWAKPGR